MGLDITAYEKVTLARAMSVQENNAEDTEERDDQAFLYQDGTRAQSDGMVDGVYDVASASFNFRAGSYSGYSGWRDELARLMLGKSAEEVWAAKAEGPFVELIDFSDCEGFIGPKTAAKLSADFANYAEKTKSADDYFREKYDAWRKAFAIASSGGVVKFH